MASIKTCILKLIWIIIKNKEGLLYLKLLFLMLLKFLAKYLSKNFKAKLFCRINFTCIYSIFIKNLKQRIMKASII